MSHIYDFLSEESAANIFKTFSDEYRIKILHLLQKKEQCANDLLEKLPISQPTLAHHLKLLVSSKVLNSRRSGKKVIYSINDKEIHRISGYLENLSTNTKKKNKTMPL